MGNLGLISGEDLFFLEITMISGEKVGNLKLISGEDFFFFGDHYDFGAKSGVFCLFGPPIFSISQSGPRLKKVGHFWSTSFKQLFDDGVVFLQSTFMLIMSEGGSGHRRLYSHFCCLQCISA